MNSFYKTGMKNDHSKLMLQIEHHLNKIYAKDGSLSPQNHPLQLSTQESRTSFARVADVLPESPAEMAVR